MPLAGRIQLPECVVIYREYQEQAVGITGAMLLADISIRTCVQEEMNLQRIAQSPLVSLSGNRIYYQTVPCHANTHNHCIISHWERIVKSFKNKTISTFLTIRENRSIQEHITKTVLSCSLFKEKERNYVPKY